MKKQLDSVKEFHEEFNVPILRDSQIPSRDRTDFRYDLMQKEVEEYFKGVQEGNLENISKELVDILYAVYGTILEYGLQDKIEDIFEEVHKSNMSKDYHEYKMVKGNNYFEPDLKKFFDKNNN